MLGGRVSLSRPAGTTWFSATRALVLLNGLVYLLQLAARRGNIPFEEWFALQPAELARGHVWQLLTFQFLHGGTLHLAINCLMLWLIGRMVEDFLGAKSFLKLYFLSGIVGGLTQCSMSLFLPERFPPDVAMVGASAGVCGLIAAFAAIHWEQRLVAWIFFILPLPMRGKFVVLLLLGLCVAGLGFDVDSPIAHAAHFGGVWMGLVYIRWIVQADRVLNGWEMLRARMLARPFIQPVDGPRPPAAPVAATAIPAAELEEELPPEEFMEREVDPILEKISRDGIQSLSDRELRVLEKARVLMAGK